MERNYRSLLDITRDAVVVRDRARVILYESPSAGMMVGCSPDGLTGEYLSRYVSDFEKAEVTIMAVDGRTASAALEIARGHGGGIEIRNNSDRGAEVRVVFPFS